MDSPIGSGGATDGGTSASTESTSPGPLDSGTAASGAETDDETRGTGDTESDPEPLPTVRLAYEGAGGVVFQDVVAGSIGEPQVVIPGDWRSLALYGDELVTSSDTNFAISSWREPDPWSVECPTEHRCTLVKFEDAWVFTVFDFLAGSSGVYRFFVGPEGPTRTEVLYPLGQGEAAGIYGSNLLVREVDESGGQVLGRIAYEVGPEVETLISFAAESDYVLAGFREFGFVVVHHVQATDESWVSDLRILDVVGDAPVPRPVPLLQGAVGHAGPNLTMHPNGDGFVLVQGDEDGVGDVAWIPFEGATLGAPVRVSTGPSQGRVEPPRGSGFPAFNATGAWLSYRARPQHDGPEQRYVVSWPGGQPVQVGDQADFFAFTPDASHLYFRSGPLASRRLTRVSLAGGVVGPEEALVESVEPGSAIQISQDGSTLAMKDVDASSVWLLDLLTTPPSSNRLSACDGYDVRFGLSEDGSVLVCSEIDDPTNERTFRILAVETGETAPLDTLYGAAILSL